MLSHSSPSVGQPHRSNFYVQNWVASNEKHELSYRKQIARQLRTQYAESVNSNPVTLKSRGSLKVIKNNETETSRKKREKK